MKSSSHFPVKLTALFLFLFPVLLSFSSASGAENSDFRDINGTPFFEAVVSLNEAGIIQGYPDGTFRPYQHLSRAEATTMICRAYGSSRLALANPYYFKDVATDMWAVSFINYCAGAGILNGYPDGTFRPDAEITYNEVIAMMVRARGLDSEDLAWPDGYLRAAGEDGMLKDLYDISLPSDGNSPANRGNTASLIASGSSYNTAALENPTVDLLADPDMSMLCCGLMTRSESGTDKLGNHCGWGRFLMGSTTYDLLSSNDDPGLFSGYNPAYGLLRVSIENGRAVSVNRITGSREQNQSCGLLTPASPDSNLTGFCRVVASDTETLSWRTTSDQYGIITLNTDTVCYEIGLKGGNVAASQISVSEISENDMAAVFSVSDGTDADIVLCVHPEFIPDILHASDTPDIMYMG